MDWSIDWLIDWRFFSVVDLAMPSQKKQHELVNEDSEDSDTETETEEETAFEVERVMGCKKVEKRLFYLVKWLGWVYSDNNVFYITYFDINGFVSFGKMLFFSELYDLILKMCFNWNILWILKNINIKISIYCP